METDRLMLVSAPAVKPYNTSQKYRRLRRIVDEFSASLASSIHICFYAAPFGVVPAELAETYPLSQFEAVDPLDRETQEFTAIQVARYVEGGSYSEVILHRGGGILDLLVEDGCRKVCQKSEVRLAVVSESQPWSEEGLTRLVALLERLGPEER
jgi:predicted RNA-binding protein